MKVIVTGATGLLGRGLIAAARRAGFETTGVGRTTSPPDGLVCDRWIAADLAQPGGAIGSGRDFRGASVFHLAADTRIYDPARDFEGDAPKLTAQACAIAQRTGGRLIFFSSSAVYSGPRTLRPGARLRESDETCPTTAYGRAKRGAEEQIGRWHPDSVVLRLFGVLSPRLPDLPDRGNLVQAIARAARTGTVVPVACDEEGASMVRDYVAEEDVFECALGALAWSRPSRGLLTVNVCTGEGTAVTEMAAHASEAAGRCLNLAPGVISATVNPVMVGDPALLRKLTGRVPANRVREFWGQWFGGRAPVPGSSRDAAAAPAPR